MSPDLSDIVSAILQADRGTLDILNKALVARYKTLSEETSLNNLTTLYVGDTVRLHNISPKFLNGAVGEIIAIDAGSKYPFRVRLTPQVRDRLVTNVSGACVYKVEA